MSVNIRYGSIVRILAMEKGAKGSIISQGFFDQAVYYQTYEDIEDFSNFRHSLFEILPRGSFEMHDEFFKAKLYDQRTKEEDHRLRSEREQYFNMIENKMNEDVYFGGEAIFKHIESSQYLSCSDHCSDLRSDSFKVCLQEHLSSNIIFRLEASRYHQQTGRPIQTKEPIRIQGEISKFWMDKNSRMPIKLDMKVSQSELRPELRGLPRDSHRYELIISHNSDITWKFSIFESFEQNHTKSNQIKDHEYCLFKFGSELLLSADLRRNVVALKKPNQGSIPLDCIWEVQFIEQKHAPSKPMQSISHLQMQRQIQMMPRNSIAPAFRSSVIYNPNNSLTSPSHGKSKFRRQVLLRHFISGKQLKFKDSIDDDDMRPALLDFESSAIELEMASSYDKELADGSFVNIKFEDYYLSKSKRLQASLQSQKSIKQFKDQGIGSFYKQLGSLETFYKCGFRDYNSSDSFIIEKVRPDYLIEIFKPLSTMELLIHFMEQIKSMGNLSQNPYCDLEHINSLITGLIKYLIGQDQHFKGDPFLIQPNPDRQVVFKELYFTELLIEILYYLCYKYGQRSISFWKYQRQNIKLLFQQSYLLCYKLIQDNPLTKLYTSQWLEMFLNQYIRMDEKYIQIFISELLNDNTQAIKKFVNQSVIEKLIEIIESKPPDEKFLRVLSAICVSNGQPISENQAIILQQYFLKIGFDYRFQFKLENNQLFVICPIKKVPKQRTIAQFYEESYAKDNLQQWNYFISYFNLLGDVCMRRNKLAKRYVEDNYPLPILTRILWECNQDSRYSMMEPLLKLIKYAYVDAHPFQRVKMISRVLTFSSLDTASLLIKELLPDDSPLREVLRFLMQFLAKFSNDSSEPCFYECQLRVLQTLKCQLEMGFWVESEKIKEILMNMYKICSNISENDGNHTMTVSKILKQKKQKQEGTHTQLLCKQLACEIISLIYNLEANARTFFAAKTFKTFMEEFKIMEKQHQQNSESKQYQSTTGSIKIFADKFKKFTSEEEKQFYEPQHWIAAFKSMIQERSLTKYENFELIFAELSFYCDKVLPKYSLQMLAKAYSQRKELTQNFEKIIIVAQGSTMELSQLSLLIYQKLEQITEPSFLEQFKEGGKNFRTCTIWYHSSDPEKAGIIQNLFQLGKLMKKDFDKGRSQNPLNYDDFCPENKSVLAYCEREQNYRLHQSLLIAQELHIHILKFIEQFDESLCSIYWKLLHACYDYLTLLIWNHMDNRMSLTRYKNVIYNHLSRNVNSIELLKVLFVNNKPLLFSEREIPLILDQVLTVCNAQQLSNYYKAKCFDFLRILLIFNSSYIDNNQTMAMQKIQEKKFNNLILTFILEGDNVASSPVSPQQISSQHSVDEYEESDQQINKLEITEPMFFQLINEFEASYERLSQGFHELEVSPQLTYIYTYFQVFSQLIEEKHKTNLKKCAKMYQFEDLMKLLCWSGYCWPLKKYLRAYINRLYYENRKAISQGFLQIDFCIILDDLQIIIDYRTQQCYTYMMMATLKNPIRYKYVFSYIYLYMEECLITLNHVLNNEQFLEDLEEYLIQNARNGKLMTHLQLFELINKLIIIGKFYHEHQIGTISRVILNILRSIVSTFDTNILLIREALRRSAQELAGMQELIGQSNEQVIASKVTELKKARDFFKKVTKSEDRDYLIDQVFDFDLDIKAKDQLNTVVKFWRSQKKKLQKEDFNEFINHKLKLVISKLSLSPMFQQYLEEEFTEVCHRMSLIGSESMRAYNCKFEVTTLKDYIQNIIQMSLTKNVQFPDELRIFFLKMLSRLITEKNFNNKDQMIEVDNWTSEYWMDYKQEITEQQNFLISCGAMDLVLQLLSETQLEIRLEILNGCLLFCITLLLGGNESAQRAVLSRLKRDSNNEVLNNFKLIITKLTKVIYNNFFINTSGTKEDEPILLTVDNYDFYDHNTHQMMRLSVNDPDDAKETSFKKLCLDVLCRFFRALQLMCENNNVGMKHYLRQQTDESNNVRIMSINFIEFTSVQLRVYLKIMSKAIITIPSAIMDFIIEIIQLPCIENQRTLCHTTFFEDVSHMSQFFVSKSNQIQRLFETEEDLMELQEFQNKILIAVLSVLEGNEEKIYKDLQNKLEVSFLVRFLSQNLQSLNIETLTDLNQCLQNQDKIFDAEMLRILNVCIIEQRMASYQECKWINQFREQLKSIPNYQEIYSKLSELIHNIEIVYQGKPMTIFFPFHPFFNLLSEQTKNELLYTVKRETQREKLLGMLEKTPILFYELDHNYKLNHYKIPITSTNLDFLQKLSSVLALSINIAMILFYTVVVTEKTYYLSSSLVQSAIINVLSFGQLFSQIGLFIMVSYQRIPILFEEEKRHDHIGQLLLLVKEDTCLLQLMLVVLSCFGTFSNSIYFVLHLMEIFSRLPLLKSVFQAISYNFRQLVVVSFLGVLFVYAFSAISFSVYFDDIYQEEAQETCDSLLTCMITLITSGVIGNSMVQWDPLKFFFDMIFTVFFGLLFTNIVQGIMIDTFAELRDKREKIDEDMKTRCFICAASKEDLEKRNESFAEHTEKKHLIWNYIFYIKCLMIKEWTEYTGLEYWIKERLEKYDISWFPESVKDGQNIEDRLDKLEQLLQSIYQHDGEIVD